MLAGAAAIQVGTANFIAPMAAVEIVEGIEKWCRDQGVRKLSDLIGALKLP